MTNLWQMLFDVSRYTIATERQRARIVLIFGMIALPVALLRLLQFRSLGTAAETAPLLAPLGISIAVLTIGSWLAFYLTRQGKLYIAQWLLVGSLVVTLLMLLFISPENLSALTVVMGTSVLLGGLLLQERGVLFAGSLNVLGILAAFVTNEAVTIQLVLPSLITLSIYSMIAFVWVHYARASQEAGQNAEVVSRFKLADITTQIVRSISTEKSMQDALTEALELIVQAYDDYYHAQVFLLDADGVTTALAASTGDVGQKLLGRRHSLNVGSVSIVGQTMLHQKPQYAYADEERSILRPNDLLPETALELGVPLMVGDTLLGMLDLQSKKKLPMKDRELAIFQSLADSLALAINNWQQLETVQKQIDEKQILAEQARSALREVERLNKRIIGRAWSEYLDDAHDIQGLDYDASTNEAEAASDWTVSLAEAAHNNTIVHQENIIAVPLLVRGQVIGAMEFEVSPDYSITPEDLELIQEIGQGFGLAAENVRLLEDSQRSARRQSVINEIGTRLQGKTNVEAILAETANSLYEAMRATRVTVRLGTPDNTGTPASAQPEVAQ